MTMTEPGTEASALEAPPPSESMPARRSRWVAALVVVGLLAAAALAGWGWRQEQQADDLAALRAERQTVRTTASDAAELLLGLDAATGAATLEKLRAMATGGFADQVDTLSSTVAGVLKQGDVASQGTVASAAVEKLDASRATVLIAATSLVSNSELPQGELRTFRLAVGLVRAGEVWKVDDVEFLG